MGLFKTIIVDNPTVRVETVIFLGPRVFWKAGGQHVHVWRQQSDLFRQIARAMAADPSIGGDLQVLFRTPVFYQWAEIWGAHVIGAFRGQQESRQFFMMPFDHHWNLIHLTAEEEGRKSFRKRSDV